MSENASDKVIDIKDTQVKNWLAYFELHVEERTYYVSFIIKAKTKEEGLKKFGELKGQHGKYHHLQLKGFNGLLEDNLDMLQEIGGGIEVK